MTDSKSLENSQENMYEKLANEKITVELIS